jgi:hypothetical protein
MKKNKAKVDRPPDDVPTPEEEAAADRAAREWFDKMLAVEPVRGETLEPKRKPNERAGQ